MAFSGLFNLSVIRDMHNTWGSQKTILPPYQRLNLSQTFNKHFVVNRIDSPSPIDQLFYKLPPKYWSYNSLPQIDSNAYANSYLLGGICSVGEPR